MGSEIRAIERYLHHFDRAIITYIWTIARFIDASEIEVCRYPAVALRVQCFLDGESLSRDSPTDSDRRLP